MLGTVFLTLVVNPITAQNFESDSSRAQVPKLEIEQELYPIDLKNLYSNLIKVETLVDLYKVNGGINYGLRSFFNINYHTGSDNFKDMVMYTQSYVGRKWYAIGAEIGSIGNKKDYFSLGPQLVIYDRWKFERLSVNSRVWPEYVLGAEYTTEEFFHCVSSTGMFRHLMETGEIVAQASIWVKPFRIDNLNLGVEYEFNNSKIQGEEHEFFLGIKFFFSK